MLKGKFVDGNFFTERGSGTGYPEKLQMLHLWMWLRPRWIGPWAIWSRSGSSSCQPWLWHGSWNLVIPGDPSNPSLSMIMIPWKEIVEKLSFCRAKHSDARVGVWTTRLLIRLLKIQELLWLSHWHIPVEWAYVKIVV